jgi:DNA-binding NtrC family response regulator
MNSPNTKKNLILYGSSILSDIDLRDELDKYFKIFPCENFEKLWLTLKEFTVSIVLFQINKKEKELDTLQRFVTFYPLIPIIVIGNSKQMEIVARAFKYGAYDFFKMPYPKQLLVERAKVLALFEKINWKNCLKD